MPIAPRRTRTSVCVFAEGRKTSASAQSNPLRLKIYKAEMLTALRNVRFWHKADIARLSSNVRFWG